MDLFDHLREQGKLTGFLIQKFIEEYGDLFYKALEFIQLDGPKVTKTVFLPSFLEIWTVQGAEKKYLVYPTLFCECQSFQINSIYRKKQFGFCKHLLALKIALSLNKYNEENYPDSNYKKWIKNL